jgi:hypothetical protein
MGTRGVSVGEVEIFPKQDQVASDGVGNLIALPLARKSLPLDNSFAPIELGAYMPPSSLGDFYCADVSEVEADVRGPSSAITATQRAIAGPLDGDLDEARDALKHIQAEEYTVWIRMGLVLKGVFGDEAFSVWSEWSQRAAAKFPGEPACRRAWDGLKPKGLLSLGSLFFAAKKGGWNGPSDPVVREMNERFGILTHGRKTMVIVKNGDRTEEDEGLVWLSKESFLDRVGAETFTVDDGRGNTRGVPKAKHWLKHARASHYHRLIFDPSELPGHNGKDWNLWNGFAVEPVPGSWAKLQDHILTNICQGDQELADWLLNWMALGIQQPADVIGTAPVLRGRPGTGKGLLANAYGRLWGVHYTTITHHEQVSGRFNAHLVGKRFVFIDEGIFGGNRRDAGVVKTRVTEPWIMLEAKGVDPMRMRNRMIFMVASNEESVVPADLWDRRWQMFEVGDARREDREYFGGIVAELDQGGYSAMLYDLLHCDVSAGLDPRRTIKTEALFDQILRAQGPEVKYLHQILDAGALPQPNAPGNGPNATTIRALWEGMQATHPSARYVPQNSLGRFLNRLIPGIRPVQSGTYIVRWDSRGSHETERSTRYIFPGLAECRRAFERHVGQPVPWSNPLEDWPSEDDV